MKEFICLFKDHNYHRKAFDRQLNITVTFLESKNILYAPFCTSHIVPFVCLRRIQLAEQLDLLYTYVWTAMNIEASQPGSFAVEFFGIVFFLAP